MHGFQGMDVEGARTGAHGLRSHSGALNEITGKLSSLIGALQWDGPDADQFRSAWQGFAPQVVRESGSAHEKGKELKVRADLQEWASSR